MHYHGILKDDMRNGAGMRVVVFLSGCSHHCDGCHNPETWDPMSGVVFTDDNMNTIIDFARDDAISGLTLSGGDPLNICNVVPEARGEDNRWSTYDIIQEFKLEYPEKDVWVYTGYKYEDLIDSVPNDREDSRTRKYYEEILKILDLADVLVDGPFIKKIANVNYPYAGSENQRVIDLKATKEKGYIVRYSD